MLFRSGEDDGKALGYRTPDALYHRLSTKFPEKFKELRAANPVSKFHITWTAEEDDALKRGMKEHGADWKKIHKSEKALGRRTPAALQIKHFRNLRK